MRSAPVPSSLLQPRLWLERLVWQLLGQFQPSLTHLLDERTHTLRISKLHPNHLVMIYVHHLLGMVGNQPSIIRDRRAERKLRKEHYVKPGALLKWKRDRPCEPVRNSNPAQNLIPDTNLHETIIADARHPATPLVEVATLPGVQAIEHCSA